MQWHKYLDGDPALISESGDSAPSEI
jgi:hypothetical protein